jgi:hypothetical protein
MRRVVKGTDHSRVITYPRVSWFLMELGTVRPAAMLSREQFNVIIHSLPRMVARRKKKEGRGMNVVD